MILKMLCLKMFQILEMDHCEMSRLVSGHYSSQCSLSLKKGKKILRYSETIEEDKKVRKCTPLFLIQEINNLKHL
jgi:hypothetical protein